MTVAQSSIISYWFKGKMLAAALGVNLSVSRLGSVLMSNTAPLAFEAHGFPFAALCGLFICVFSLGAAFGLAAMDRHAEKLYPAGRANMEGAGDFKMSDIWNFKLPFWLLTGSCVITYMSILPYFQIAPDMLQEKFGFTVQEAGFYCSIPYTISLICSPIFGALIDFTGKRGHYISLSSVILIAAFLNSSFTPACNKCYNEIITLVMCGLGYTIYAAAIWGSVPYVVKPATVGTAFGVCTAI